MLDVHIMVMPTTPHEFVGQCIASVTAAVSVASFPVYLHVMPAVQGHIGRARALGYSQGMQPYVSFVDDDDYVMPNAFAVLQAELEAGRDAVFTRELRLQNDKFCKAKGRHHMDVCRREIACGFDFEPWRFFQDVALRRHVEGMDCADVDEHVYVHRLLPNSNARVMHAAHRDDIRSEYAQLAR
jgi:hypothetical protein